MATTEKNRQQVHAAMWEQADHRGKVTFHQREVAKRLGLSIFQMCRAVQDLETDGKVRQIGSRYRNVGVYVVEDPAT